MQTLGAFFMCALPCAYKKRSVGIPTLPLGGENNEVKSLFLKVLI